jgi:outer membrane lipoprotein-sorting protein
MRQVTRMMTWLSVLTVAVYAQDKPGPELTDPVEILKKADAACKAVNAAQYKATYKSTGPAAMQRPEVEGTALITGWANNAPEKYRIEAKIKQPNSTEVRNIVIGSDGQEYYLIDHDNKKVYADIDRMVIGRTGAPAIALVTPEFLHPTPFTDEINAEKQELRGSKTIGGEDCYEVYVKYTGGQLQSVWCFSKKDFLPRARQNTFKAQDGSDASAQGVLTDLVPDPKLSPDAFKLKVPEGYTKVDDFAP